MRPLHLVLTTLLLVGPSGCSPSADQDSVEETREIMGRLLASLHTLLAYRESSSPEDAGDTLAASRVFAREAEALAVHAGRMDETADYVGSSLAHDAREIEDSLERGSSDRARYLIRHVTENCVACHARLPGVDSLRAENFVSSGTLARLAPGERARLQVATRRFGDALDTLEALLLSPEVQPVLLIDALTDYLIVAVRVLADFERPVPVLQLFAERTDVWPELRGEVLVWASSLPELALRVPEHPDLDSARRLIKEGQSLFESAGDRSGLAHDVVASGILLGLVDAGSVQGAELAEAYYWLAIVASRIARAYRLSPADFFLERSIRLAPSGRYARDAYALLEEQALLSYEGVDEVLPAEERERLAELRKLVDRAAKY